MGDWMNYIKRHIGGIEVNQELGSIIINTSLKKYINSLCMKNLSTYQGRIISTQKFLEETSNIPIYIDKETCLYSTKSIRDYNTVFINYHEVLSIRKVSKDYTCFIFNNLNKITFKVSENKVKKQHNRINKILDYIMNNN